MLGFLLLGLSSILPSSGAQLLRDINTSVVQASSSPRQVTMMGDTAFFVAEDDTHGAELWRSDGTDAGTFLLSDIRPGPDSSWPEDFIVANGVLYFSADDGVNGRELWRSDGSQSGTYMLADIAPGSGSGFVGTTVTTTGGVYFSSTSVTSLYPIVASGPFIYFIASDGVAGAELWRTNGMLSGTIRLTQLAAAGSRTTSIRHMIPFGSKLAFTASDTQGGEELWISDGTPEGTSRASDINPGSGNSSPDQLVVAADQLFFTATDGQHGRELWLSDGTAGGTRMIVDMTAGAADTLITNLTAVGSQVFFAASYGLWRSDGTAPGTFSLSSGQTPKYLTPFGQRVVYRTGEGDPILNTRAEIWISDGTAAGTSRLFQSMTPDNANRRISAPLVVGSRIYFMDQTDSDGLGIWLSDGTSAGTVVVKSMAPPSSSTSEIDLTRLHLEGAAGTGVVYFTDPNAQFVRELWRTDGTPAGTVRLSTLNTLPSSSYFPGVAVGQSLAYFTPYTEAIGTELSVTDGSVAGTHTVKDIAVSHQNDSSVPLDFTQVGNRMLFTAQPATTVPFQLWSTDGTPGGTQLFYDVTGGTSNGGVFNLVKFGSGALFTGSTPATGYELWTTDGTVGGTRLVKDLIPGAEGSHPWLDGGVALGSKYIFPATSDSGVLTIWASNGTAAGTVLLHSGNEATNTFVAAGSLAYFTLSDPTNGYVLWQTDGTAAGTRASLPANMKLTAPVGSAGGYLFFQGSVVGDADQLWRTDGTNAGTVKLTSLSMATGAGASPGSALGEKLIFTICPFLGTCGIYASDGSVAGTVRLADGTLQHYLSDRSLVVDGVLYFSGLRLNQTLTEPWVTDGTSGGTHPINPSNTGELSYPADFVSFGGAVEFAANSPKYGRALFRTDGTPQGTWLVATGYAGPISVYSPDPQGANASPRLIFGGGNYSTGSEPFELTATDPVAGDDSYIISPPVLTRFNLVENDGIVNGVVDPTTVTIVAAPLLGTATVDSNTGQVVYTPSVPEGRDSFTYTVRSKAGAVSNIARVDVVIGGADGGTPPVGGSSASGGTGGGTGTGGSDGSTGGTSSSGGGASGGGAAGSSTNGDGSKSGGGGAMGVVELEVMGVLIGVSQYLRRRRLNAGCRGGQPN
jgi:ELWxxDGT repeat protein